MKKLSIRLRGGGAYFVGVGVVGRPSFGVIVQAGDRRAALRQGKARLRQARQLLDAERATAYDLVSIPPTRSPAEREIDRQRKAELYRAGRLRHGGGGRGR